MSREVKAQSDPATVGCQKLQSHKLSGLAGNGIVLRAADFLGSTQSFIRWEVQGRIYTTAEAEWIPSEPGTFLAYLHEVGKSWVIRISVSLRLSDLKRLADRLEFQYVIVAAQGRNALLSPARSTIKLSLPTNKLRSQPQDSNFAFANLLRRQAALAHLRRWSGSPTNLLERRGLYVLFKNSIVYIGSAHIIEDACKALTHWSSCHPNVTLRQSAAYVRLDKALEHLSPEKYVWGQENAADIVVRPQDLERDSAYAFVIWQTLRNIDQYASEIEEPMGRNSTKCIIKTQLFAHTMSAEIFNTESRWTRRLAFGAPNIKRFAKGLKLSIRFAVPVNSLDDLSSSGLTFFSIDDDTAGQVASAAASNDSEPSGSGGADEITITGEYGNDPQPTDTPGVYTEDVLVTVTDSDGTEESEATITYYMDDDGTLGEVISASGYVLPEHTINENQGGSRPDDGGTPDGGNRDGGAPDAGQPDAATGQLPSGSQPGAKTPNPESDGADGNGPTVKFSDTPGLPATGRIGSTPPLGNGRSSQVTVNGSGFTDPTIVDLGGNASQQLPSGSVADASSDLSVIILPGFGYTDNGGFISPFEMWAGFRPPLHGAIDPILNSTYMASSSVNRSPLTVTSFVQGGARFTTYSGSTRMGPNADGLFAVSLIDTQKL